MRVETWKINRRDEPGDDEQRLDNQVLALAESIIEEHHEHLRDAVIVYLWRKPAQQSKGRTILGTARKATGGERALHDDDDTAPDFVITLAYGPWAELNNLERKALLDHELCHCSGSREDGFAMRAHDVEEFREIVERHGFWKPDVKEFAGAVQRRLPGLGGPRLAEVPTRLDEEAA